MVRTYDPTKLQERFHWPCQIIQVFMNGMVRVQKLEAIDETDNISKIVPYTGRMPEGHRVEQLVETLGKALGEKFGPSIRIHSAKPSSRQPPGDTAAGKGEGLHSVSWQAGWSQAIDAWQ
eukprot:jgi/Psemu1/23305/gm1.23305_g